ncbi:MAG TPA: hypothetical protein VGL72_10600 [Bryobacteraceae bacterium]|jgi:hypothetical protein
MREPKKKSKMISIRLSSEEYESMKAAFASRGIRSVSEFARDAMQRLLHAPPLVADGHGPSPGDLEFRMRSLDSRVTRLQGEVSNLSRLVVGRGHAVAAEDGE